NLVVDSNVKKVQHPTGGVIKELLVREGDQVQAGDVLVRMDDTQTRANLAIIVKGLAELYARQARLEAERDDADKLDFSDIDRVTQVERDAARNDGERNSLISSVAQTKGKMTETELQILQVDQDLHGEVAKELREIQGKIGEALERKVAAEDMLQKIELRAPQ